MNRQEELEAAKQREREEARRIEARIAELEREQEEYDERLRAEGALAERQRIKRELLAEIEDMAEKVEGYLCGEQGQCNLAHHVGFVVDVAALKDEINRICPEEPSGGAEEGQGNG
jgi:DNA repair exonuclease SbcCD ATPase subunit